MAVEFETEPGVVVDSEKMWYDYHESAADALAVHVHDHLKVSEVEVSCCFHPDYFDVQLLVSLPSPNYHQISYLNWNRSAEVLQTCHLKPYTIRTF